MKLLCLLDLLPRRFPVVHLVHHETIPPHTQQHTDMVEPLTCVLMLVAVIDL